MQKESEPLPEEEKDPAEQSPLPADELHPAKQNDPARHAKHALSDADDTLSLYVPAGQAVQAGLLPLPAVE